MKLKFNWGYGVALLYTGFAILIITLVMKSMNEKIDLVSADYYARELKYQDRIESTERNNELSQPAYITQDEKGVWINFPDEFKPEAVSGTIQVFRPSDKLQDFEVPVRPGKNHRQLVPVKSMKSGMYRVRVDYSYDDKSYYMEKQVVVK